MCPVPSLAPSTQRSRFIPWRMHRGRDRKHVLEIVADFGLASSSNPPRDTEKRAPASEAAPGERCPPAHA
eukprot:scaffold5962_cov331-Prasinococcus_capsulatus_cf.AAC.1